MIRIEPTRDAELIRGIITDPRVYPWVSDDAAPPAAEFQPEMAITYLLAMDDGHVLGLFAVFPQNQACWEFHTCLLDGLFGGKALAAAREMTAWGFANTTAVRLVTNVPACNRVAVRFAKLMGLEQYGRNPASYRKHGKLQDQVLFGISKG